jgi:hypothetical protein
MQWWYYSLFASALAVRHLDGLLLEFRRSIDMAFSSRPRQERGLRTISDASSPKYGLGDPASLFAESVAALY